MVKVIVIRTSDNGQQTEGVMLVVDETDIIFKCYTLELPWKDNRRNISCIPKGTYQVQKLTASPAFGYPHLWIKHVPNRSMIKIHRANYVHQLRGCIAVGAAQADLNADGLKDITSSAITLDNLLAMVPDNFQIEII